MSPEELKSVMKTEWTTANLDTVLTYYYEGFKIPEGYKLWNCETYVDTMNRKVAFHLYLAPKK